MSPEEKHARSVEVADKLLEYARIKRSASALAKGAGDVLKKRHLIEEAALIEVAANLLDESHEAQGWKLNP